MGKISDAYLAGIETAQEEVSVKEAGVFSAIGRGIAGAGRQMGLWGTKTKNIGNLAHLSADPVAQKAAYREFIAGPGQRTMGGFGKAPAKGTSFSFNSGTGNIDRTTTGWWNRQSTLGKAGYVGVGGLAAGGYGAGKVMDHLNEGDEEAKARYRQPQRKMYEY